MSLDQIINIKTNSIETTYQKLTLNNFTNNVTDFKTPLLCNELESSFDNCLNITLTSQFSKISFALQDLNDGYVSTKESNLISLSFFNENNQELIIKNTSQSFEFTIPRVSTFKLDPFKFINPYKSYNNVLWLSKITTNKSNVSIHYQFTSSNKSDSYLGVIKFGSNAYLNNDSYSFDIWKIFCSNKNSLFDSQYNKTYYELFSNMSNTLNFTGDISIGLKQLNLKESEYFCLNDSFNNSDLNYVINNIDKDYNKISNISSRVLLSGCYYIDKNTGTYSSFGMEILESSNLTHIKCLSNHLTQFASGLIVVPNEIDFDSVFANASFENNLSIYLTVIFVCLLYIVLSIITNYKDKKDKLKLNINISLADPDDNYYYEIIFFTSNKFGSSTKSNIRFKLYGDYDESEIFTIDYKNQLKLNNNVKLFQSGSIDSFIISSNK